MSVAIMSVRNWDRFQHYKDRDPPWVKLYRDLLTAESWVLGTDTSRVVQVASILLAARYGNQIPYRWDLIRKVASLDCTEKQFNTAVDHLVSTEFLEIQGCAEQQAQAVQSASTPLATCSTEGEQSREEGEQRRAEDMSASRTGNGAAPESVEIVFDHWRQTHNHPKAKLDGKRRRLIRDRLNDYSEADLCQAITGYLNSPHHMGADPKGNGTVYDAIELFLRDSKHVDMGLKFAREPPRKDLSGLTRRNAAATEDWEPPEVRHANH